MIFKRKKREQAIQILYQIESNNIKNKHALITNKKIIIHFIDKFFYNFSNNKKFYSYTLKLVIGTCIEHKKIDNIISNHSIKWKLSRILLVDKNILRIAIYELLFELNINTNIIINEAIETGKKFGTKNSFSFINGVLNSVANSLR